MANLVPVQVKGNVGTIEDNLDLVEISIREKVAEYSAVVVTEDTVKEGKRFLADIRKEKKALDDERKEIKAQWMAPYEAFEKRAKQIIALYDEPVRIIDNQLAEYEEERKRLKRQGIQEIYDFVKGDLGEWLPLDRIYNQKWENATYGDKKIREDMELIFDQLKVSISTVKSMNSEFEEDALDVLKETGSLQSAISKINDLQRQKERFLEQARQEAERERQEAERKRLEEEQKRFEEEQKRAEAKQAETDIAEEAPQDLPTTAPTACQPASAVDVWSGTGVPVAEPEITDPDEEPEAPFAMEKTLTVMVKVGENSIDTLKEFLDAIGLEYEVMM